MKRFLLAAIAMHGLCSAGQYGEKSLTAIRALELADEMLWRLKR